MRILIVLVLMSAVWLGILLRLGIGRATITPAEGILSRTFEGWATYPASRHLFLAQLKPNDFASSHVYTSFSYPHLFANFLLLAPIHFLFGVPYNVAHNFLPYFNVFCLLLLFIVSTTKQLHAIFEEKRFLLWSMVFICLGILITNPLPWTSSFNAARENPHILAAGLFSYLSTWVFYGKVPRTALMIVGIVLAVFGSMYVPAWILAGLFFHRTLDIDRKWAQQVLAVSALAVVNVALPPLVVWMAGATPAGSSFLFRSGLDGSTQYMTSIFQAVVLPIDPRHWPTATYVLIAGLLAVYFQFFFKHRGHACFHPLRQAIFLLIPYATIAIFLPQLTSIHPYTTDLLLFVPATFLMSFWFLQDQFWKKLSGKTYVIWLLVASFVLMTNLLAVAQMPRFAAIERRSFLFVLGAVAVSFCLYWIVKAASSKMRANPSAQMER